MRGFARTDDNQQEIIKAIRSLGASVQSLHKVGQGCPDLLCAVAEFCFLVEVKDGSKPPSKQKLTPDQVDWHSKWRSPVYIVNSVQGAVDLVQQLIRENQ
jgi:hypothetical protein